KTLGHDPTKGGSPATLRRACACSWGFWVRMLRIFGHFVPAATATLGFGEAVIITMSLYFGVALFVAVEPDSVAGGMNGLPLVLALCILAMMHSGGLYHPDALVDLRRTVRRGALILTLILVLAWILVAKLSAPQLVRIRHHWPLILLLGAIWLA